MQSEAISDSMGKQPTAASGAGTYSRNKWYSVVVKYRTST